MCTTSLTRSKRRLLFFLVNQLFQRSQSIYQACNYDILTRYTTSRSLVVPGKVYVNQINLYGLPSFAVFDLLGKWLDQFEDTGMKLFYVITELGDERPFSIINRKPTQNAPATVEAELFFSRFTPLFTCTKIYVGAYRCIMN